MTNFYEYKLISLIAKRALTELIIPTDHQSMMMDIEFTHEINPLRLADLLDADLGNFGHDLSGIYNNFNRATRQLDNFWIPRYSV